MTRFTESVVEDAALAWLEGLGYGVLYGPEIAFGEPGAERLDPDYRDVVLVSCPTEHYCDTMRPKSPGGK
jgi:type I restriction enzyme R subunit